MRSVSFILSAIAFLFCISQTTRTEETSPLLDSADLILERLDRTHGPALSSTTNDRHTWESDNQWMCFPSSQVEIDSTEVFYSGSQKKMPQFTVESLGHHFDITPSDDLTLDSEKTIEEWSLFLRDSSEVCFYAAFLQYLIDEDDLPHSLWILERFKTSNGYWFVGRQ